MKDYLLNQLVGATVEYSVAGKPVEEEKEAPTLDVKYMFDKGLTVLRSAHERKTKAFLICELVKAAKIHGKEKLIEDIPAGIVDDSTLNAFMDLAPKEYAELLRDHYFGLRGGEKSCCLFVIKYFRIRKEKLAYVFDKVLTVSDVKSM